MFSGKVLLALPFWRHTAGFFTQEQRDLFPYTAVLEPDGVQLADGTFMDRERFVNWRLKERRYYLKYAGVDTSRNGGSRGVHKVDTTGHGTRETVRTAWDEARLAIPWILQEAIERDPAGDERIRAECGLEQLGAMHEKLSVYCCYGRYFGTTLMLRKTFKVHGQVDTTITIPVERPPSRIAEDGRLVTATASAARRT
jgi:hypothetical protein